MTKRIGDIILTAFRRMAPSEVPFIAIAEGFGTQIIGKSDWSVFYRGTSAAGAINEITSADAKGVNRSVSILQLNQDSQIHSFRSKLWRENGLAFLLTPEELGKMLCFIGAKDSFTGRDGYQTDDDGNLVDDNLTQQLFGILTLDEREKQIQQFLEDDGDMHPLLRRNSTNEALLHLTGEDYDKAFPCLNGDF